MLKPATLFRKSGMISVWIGHFRTPDELDEYMSLTAKFENDFGFELDEGDIRESTVEQCPKTISQLVDGFSACHSFADNVVRAAKAAGIEMASTMLISYGFEFVPSSVEINPNAPLKFIGSFSFSE